MDRSSRPPPRDWRWRVYPASSGAVLAATSGTAGAGATLGEFTVAPARPPPVALSAVLALSATSGGFTVAEFTAKVHAMTGHTGYTTRQAAYDLRTLRGAPPTFRTADPIGSSAGKDLISGEEISEIHA